MYYTVLCQGIIPTIQDYRQEDTCTILFHVRVLSLPYMITGRRIHVLYCFMSGYYPYHTGLQVGGYMFYTVSFQDSTPTIQVYKQKDTCTILFHVRVLSLPYRITGRRIHVLYCFMSGYHPYHTGLQVGGYMYYTVSCQGIIPIIQDYRQEDTCTILFHVRILSLPYRITGRRIHVLYCFMSGYYPYHTGLQVGGYMYYNVLCQGIIPTIQDTCTIMFHVRVLSLPYRIHVL